MQRLARIAPDLELLLTRGGEGSPPRYAVSEIVCQTVYVSMRDQTRLATDLYLPPTRRAPVIVMRTPYGRGMDRVVSALMAFARRGYAVVSQDCRGTGDSEPDSWDYYIFESEDGYDLIEWVVRQDWFGGFIGSCGGSYVGQTQWPMATHPAMSTIVPHMSGLGIARNTAHLHMFCNSYGRAVGKGTARLAGVHYSEVERLMEAQTMATGYFNEPLHKPFSAAVLARFPRLHSMPPTQATRWLWEQYCSASCAERAAIVKQALEVKSVSIVEVESLCELFGHSISHDALTIPQTRPAASARAIRAPVLLFTGWYDWCLNDAFATWETLRRDGRDDVRARSRMIVTPHAHNTLGYREGIDTHPELQIVPGMTSHSGVLLRWYQTIRDGKTDAWPAVIYYMMGANEWWMTDDWPPLDAKQTAFYLNSDGALTAWPPQQASAFDSYNYDPNDPTPTVGGSIVSFLYPPGSVDVSAAQKRLDVLVYTTAPLEQDLDVVGPLRMVLYASSSARDTDFAVRLSDVFPDGRAIQLQHCILRARYRNPEPELLEPGRIYRFEIDLWATANRFRTTHRLRLDISSADFPKFDRNSNRGGEPGAPLPAKQIIYRDREHPSHLLVPVVGKGT